MTNPDRITPGLGVVLVAILLSGALFGYDQGVISGALDGIKAEFSLSALLIEVVTSWVTLGALAGALLGGELADAIGRHRTVLIAGVVFTLGSLVEAFAPDTLVLVGGRLVVGLGVGIAAVAAPLYAAELAPSALRGRFISAYLVDGWLAKDDSWRWMLGLSAAPGVLLIGMALIAPESPRWLMRMDRRADAEAALRRLHPDAAAGPALDEIAAALARDRGKASWGEVFGAQWRRPLMVGIGLVGMGVSLAMAGAAFGFMTGRVGGMVTLGALVVFIGSFAFSMGPVVWTVINEIFPGHIRGRAVAVATAFNWAAAFMVSQLFLSLIGALGNAATFGLLALVCAAGWAWIYRAVPETKGRSLEQIQQIWQEAT